MCSYMPRKSTIVYHCLHQKYGKKYSKLQTYLFDTWTPLNRLLSAQTLFGTGNSGASQHGRPPLSEEEGPKKESWK